MKLMQLRRRALGVGLGLGLLLAACGGGGGGGVDVGAGGGTGTLRLALTDAPACGFDKVNVTIDRVRVHQSGSAAESDAGWTEVVVNPARRVDLLALTNGVLSELGQTALPAGKYTQLRLVLAENGGATPLANSVLPTGSSTEVALTTPSAQQAGLKLKTNIDVAANQMADFVIDFDACKSVVSAGNSGKYNLKPVLKVIPRYVSGVSGFIDASAAGGASVSLQQAGVAMRTTTPDASGKFLLQPVAPGSYTLVLTAPARTTLVVTGVTVTADTVSALNVSTGALNPPMVAAGALAGTVTMAATPIDASVRVLQPLTGGPAIEVAARPVDGTSGAYSYRLPVTAPLVAAFPTGLGTLAFTPDNGAAGKYNLEAVSGTSVKTSGPVTLTANGSVITNFTLP